MEGDDDLDYVCFSSLLCIDFIQENLDFVT